MIKHVGRHNNKKVVVVFRELPDMEHMALVVYPDTIAANFHDPLMEVVESISGQQSNDLSEVLHRNLFPDGTNMLTKLHQSGWLKKVPTNQVILVSSAKSQHRLDEINTIINKLKVGGEGARELAELDAQSGMYDPAKIADVQDVSQFAAMDEVTEVLGEGVLDNAALAKAKLEQVAEMQSQLSGLQAEIASLTEEAYEMDPSLRPKKAAAKKTTSKKAAAKKSSSRKRAVTGAESIA